MLFVYTLTIFVGASLLFLVQPLFARMMLPQLGGSPAVWNTAMVFYQAALLAGYAYAHFAIRQLGARRQSVLHLLLIALPFLFLPIGLSSQLTPPTENNPSWWMLAMMAGAVGLPFFVVSTTSPLLQRWFHATGHPAAADPYFLYAASNAGSLLALLAYPTLIEPNWTLEVQSRWWSVGYGLFAVLVVVCGILLWRSPRNEAAQSVSGELSAPAEEEISHLRRLRWVLLAFVPSSLMLSVTAYLTTDIAAVPLLWIIPLTLYLLTFVIVFAARPLIPRWLAVRALPVVVLPLVVVMAAGVNSPIIYLIPLHLVTFFIIALACHGALASDRPAPVHLTEFYLWLSVGGVLGGTFNALLAPVIFDRVTEYPLVLVLACALALPGVRKASQTQKVLDVLAPIVVGALCATLILMLQSRELTSEKYVLGAMFGIPAFIAFGFSHRPLRFALAVGAILLASTLRSTRDEEQLLAERSFFGVHRVLRLESGGTHFHRLLHGSTLHGLQNRDPAQRREPLTYYARSGPLGHVIFALENLHGVQFEQIAAMGLGTGTVAAHAQPWQEWTFYEIDPAVQAIAENPAYFTYLRDSRAPYRIILGDGRLQIARAPDGQYDLLILDAYSSDSLPVHLLTREAVHLYARKLAPGGVMAFHISNRHLDLEPLMAAFARDLGWAALSLNESGLTSEETSIGKTGSHWVVLARKHSDFGELTQHPDWVPPYEDDEVPLWTDNYSSLLSVFEWK